MNKEIKKYQEQVKAINKRLEAGKINNYTASLDLAHAAKLLRNKVNNEITQQEFNMNAFSN